jgi:hypothetical protein
VDIRFFHKHLLKRLSFFKHRWDGEPLAGAGACAQQPGAGKLVRVVEGGKLHRRGGKTHFPHEL